MPCRTARVTTPGCRSCRYPRNLRRPSPWRTSTAILRLDDDTRKGVIDQARDMDSRRTAPIARRSRSCSTPSGSPSGRSSEPADAGGGPLLAHGPLEPGRGRVVIPHRPADAASLTDDLVHRLEVDGGPDAVLPVDVVSVIGALLRDEADGAIGRRRPRRARPGPLRRRARRPAPTRPARSWTGSSSGRAGGSSAGSGSAGADRWPDGARFAVGLSHDVDHPDRYPTIRALTRGPQRLRRAPRTLAVRATDDLASLLRGPHPGEFWVFDRLVESEASRGFAATWFFASTPFHDRWGTTYDVAYDIADQRFRRVFDQLAEAGHEVGLHTGYEAYAAPGRIAEERERLVRRPGRPSTATGITTGTSARTRPPRCAPTTPPGSGTTARSPSTTTSASGGRRACRSIRSIRPPTRRCGLRQLPVFAMDGNLFYRSNDVEAAVATIADGLDDVAGLRGMAVFDWHLQACVPTRSGLRPVGRGVPGRAGPARGTDRRLGHGPRLDRPLVVRAARPDRGDRGRPGRGQLAGPAPGRRRGHPRLLEERVDGELGGPVRQHEPQVLAPGRVASRRSRRGSRGPGCRGPGRRARGRARGGRHRGRRRHRRGGRGGTRSAPSASCRSGSPSRSGPTSSRRPCRRGGRRGARPRRRAPPSGSPPRRPPRARAGARGRARPRSCRPGCGSRSGAPRGPRR